MDIQKFIKRMVSPKSVFTLLVFLSTLVILFMLLPDYGSVIGNKILNFWGLHAFSGVVLVIITYRDRISGKAKLFLLLSGFSAIGFVLGGILHNLFYALSTLTENLTALNVFLNFLEVSFFLIAIIICPIGLVVGVAGTIVLWNKITPVKKQKRFSS